MNPEKRFFLALVLAFVFSAIWMEFMQARQAKNPQSENVKKDVQENVEKVASDENASSKEKLVQEIMPATKVADSLNIIKNEEFISVETDKYLMKWSNRGASLVSLKLKNYFHDNIDKTQENWQQNKDNWLTVLPEFSQSHHSLEILGNGTILDENGKEQSIFLNNALWNVEQNLNNTPAQLTFTLGPINGIVYKKEFIFEQNANKISGKITLTNVSNKVLEQSYELTGSAGIAIEGNYSDITRSVYSYIMYPNAKNQPLFKSYEYSKIISNNAHYESNIAWASLVNRYFAYILHVKQPEKIKSILGTCFDADYSWVQETLERHKEKGEHAIKETDIRSVKQIQLSLQTAPIRLQPAETSALEFDFFVDTKASLSKMDATYSTIDDYGFFGFISKILLLILDLFYKLVHNYGIAIICLTILIKLVLFPMTRKQQISMQKYQSQMKIFQPELKKLQEKYKNDRNKLSQETMALYKKHNINPFPLGGCLPLLLQIPIFFGLYQALFYSVHLRQASFLWIADLSQPDKLYHFGSPVPYIGDYFNLLPVVMTIVWVIQQKLMPKPEDPQMQQQQKMFAFMSIIFGFMFYHVASGLVLYWMVMNFLSIIEQTVIKRQMNKKA